MPPKQRPKQAGILSWAKPLMTDEDKAQQQARQQAEVERSKSEAEKQREKRQRDAEEAASHKRGPGIPGWPWIPPEASQAAEAS
jgi:hypothetical protein